MKDLKKILIAAAILFFTLGANGEIHQWTNLNGQTIQAGFVSATAEIVTISMKGKTYELPMVDLSRESQILARKLSRPKGGGSEETKLTEEGAEEAKVDELSTALNEALDKIILGVAADDPQAIGKEYLGLEVGFTFREVEVDVDFPVKEEEERELTKNDVERAVKLKLLNLGLKQVENSPTGSIINVKVHIFSTALHIQINLEKYALHYGIPLDGRAGMTFSPEQGTYSSLGTHIGDKEFILYTLDKYLGKFVLDYLKSNQKYASTSEDKKLKGVDRIVEADAKGETLKLTTQLEWRNRYDALLNTKKESRSVPVDIPPAEIPTPR